ncbi:MAG: helix-turn-helix transcriptional regulator [Rudaea sp.]|nr:helix-turn-helix transcriptional regulator [Rudaea sp.]
MKSIAKAIKEKRVNLGLTDTHVADYLALPIEWYGDVEQHEEEFETTLPSGTAVRLCEKLGLNMLDLLAIRPGEFTGSKSLGASDVIEHARCAKNISQNELAEHIGFDIKTVEQLESDPRFIGTLPLRVLFDIEACLNLPKGALVSKVTAD